MILPPTVSVFCFDNGALLRDVSYLFNSQTGVVEENQALGAENLNSVISGALPEGWGMIARLALI